jgi:hypothetical protein
MIESAETFLPWLPLVFIEGGQLTIVSFEPVWIVAAAKTPTVRVLIGSCVFNSLPPSFLFDSFYVWCFPLMSISFFICLFVNRAATVLSQRQLFGSPMPELGGLFHWRIWILCICAL